MKGASHFGSLERIKLYHYNISSKSTLIYSKMHAMSYLTFLKIIMHTYALFYRRTLVFLFKC